MRILLLTGVFLLLWMAPASAEDGGWKLERPKSSPHGEKHTLRVTLDGAKAHRGEVTYEQTSKMEQGGLTVRVGFTTHVRVIETTEDGRIRVGGELGITKLALGDDDLTERVQGGLPGAHVTGLVQDRRVVTGCRKHLLEPLQQLGRMFGGLPALLLPYLPEADVRVGEVWDLPPQYVLWNVQQPMNGKPVGASFQVFEAIEKKGGVDCARIRTAVSVRTELPRGAGMLPKGPAVSQIKIEMRHWLGLDGYLRAAETSGRMLVTHTETQKTIHWRMQRWVKAGPSDVPAEPLGKSWAAFMGKLPFVVGYEAGMREAKFTGRAPMFFVTTHGSGAGRALAAKAFGNEKVCKSLAGFTPILIDGEVEAEFVEQRGKGNVLMNPTILWEDFEGGTIFTLAGGLPDIPGVDSAEMAETMFSTPAGRTPKATPSEGYLALVKVRDELRAAVKASDRKAAVAAVLAIQLVGQGQAIQMEAAEADKVLVTYARGRMKEAADLMKTKDGAAKGRALLASLATEFKGHAVAAQITQLLDQAGTR